MIAAITLTSCVSKNNSRMGLKQTEECMLDILKNAPDIEIVDSWALPEPTIDGMEYRFVRYRFHGNLLTYSVTLNGDSFWFSAVLPIGNRRGVDRLPDRADERGDSLTGNVEGKWKTQCGDPNIVIIIG